MISSAKIKIKIKKTGGSWIFFPPVKVEIDISIRICICWLSSAEGAKSGHFEARRKKKIKAEKEFKVEQGQDAEHQQSRPTCEFSSSKEEESV